MQATPRTGTKARNTPETEPTREPTRQIERPRQIKVAGATIVHEDFLKASRDWPAPTVIISDGPYGVNSYPGDLASPEELPDWYRPHVQQWAERALPSTTLWFWNTEIGWATCHPLLDSLGWKYRACHIWDKGWEHIAGNSNSKTLRGFPIVTEVCIQYVRKVEVNSNGVRMGLKEWARHEWERSGLSLHKANEACGVKNAASRKYLTKCHLWYFPPPDAFALLAQYANEHGNPEGKPYYSIDGSRPATSDEWALMRAKFHCEFGITNVWREPTVRGPERIKSKHKPLHQNQKSLQLLEQAIRASSDQDDVVWEPFGGLCSAAIAAINTGRKCFSSEINKDFYRAAHDRLKHYTPSAPTNGTPPRLTSP